MLQMEVMECLNDTLKTPYFQTYVLIARIAAGFIKLFTTIINIHDCL